MNVESDTLEGNEKNVSLRMTYMKTITQSGIKDECGECDECNDCAEDKEKSKEENVRGMMVWVAGGWRKEEQHIT